MGGVIDDFMSVLGNDVASQASSKLGVGQDTIKQIIPQIAPLILGGLKRQKDEHGGADRVDHILNKYGDAGVLDNLSNLFETKAKDENPDPNLGGLLGSSGGGDAVNVLSNKFNVDGSILMKLIPMLAPILLGFLTKKRDTDGLGSSGIASLLDQDGDGSVIDDVAGFLLQGMSEGSAKKSSGGLLGSLLGGLLGGRRK